MSEEILKAIPASDRIAIGPAYCYFQPELTTPARAAETAEQEMERFQAAREQARLELLNLYDSVKVRIGQREAAIFEAHHLMLVDPILEQNIREQVHMGDLRRDSLEFLDSAPVGIMVETPAAAVLVDVLAEASDFFSLGTDDLTQYTMAVDRGNAKVASLFQPLHPAVLRLIKQTIEAGHANGKWVGMWGELAGMQKAIPILLGFGSDEFSMNPRAIPEARHLISQLTDEQARQIAAEALSLPAAAEIEQTRKEFLASL